MTFDGDAKTDSTERKMLSINGASTTGYPYGEKKKHNFNFYFIKINSRQITGLKIKAETIKLLENNGQSLQYKQISKNTESNNHKSWNEFIN